MVLWCSGLFDSKPASCVRAIWSAIQESESLVKVLGIRSVNSGAKRAFGKACWPSDCLICSSIVSTLASWSGPLASTS